MTMTDLPRAMRDLPRDKHGRPVPYFVAWPGAEPDFRVIEGNRFREAVRCSLCWVCGKGFRGGEDRAWVIGPMCAVNRISAEPPCHLDCATWSAQNCPFLTTPNMTRRERHMPDGTSDPAGIMLKRNPGVTCVWITSYRNWKIEKQPGKGILFRVGDAKGIRWFACGWEASRDEVLAAIDSGMPILEDIARNDGPDAEATLADQYDTALGYLPLEDS